jgi:hypothetical protein
MEKGKIGVLRWLRREFNGKAYEYMPSERRKLENPPSVLRYDKKTKCISRG